MKAVCPFCGTSFVRHPRALLANKFCNRCIDDRLNHDGKGEYPLEYSFTVDSDEYSQFKLIDCTA